MKLATSWLRWVFRFSAIRVESVAWASSPMLPVVVKKSGGTPEPQKWRRAGFQTPRADLAHAFLWRRLQNGGHVRLALAGSRLNHQLRGERNQADYDLHRDLAQHDAAAAVKSAAIIIDTLHGLSADERLLITEAIKTYEGDILRESTWRNRPR